MALNKTGYYAGKEIPKKTEAIRGEAGYPILEKKGEKEFKETHRVIKPGKKAIVTQEDSASNYKGDVGTLFSCHHGEKRRGYG